MTDYRLICDCGHDAGDHDDHGRWERKYPDAPEHTYAAHEMVTACPRTAASLYAAECARISGHLAKLQEAHAIVWAERDAARAECEQHQQIAHDAIMSAGAMMAERDRYKAALETLTACPMQSVADFARTALDANRETDNVPFSTTRERMPEEDDRYWERQEEEHPDAHR